MNECVVLPGQIIFREGEPGGEAYVIQSGRVEIFKDSANGPIVLANLEESEMFGEMSLIDEQPRSATARAIGEVELRKITLDDFVDILDSQPEDTFRYLRSLYERIRTMNARLDKPTDHRAKEPPRASARTAVLILPSSPAASQAVPAGGMAPRRFPVRAGRMPNSSEAEELDINDIRLTDSEPFNVSRDHFSVCIKGGRAYLKDRGSYLGTIVNGVTVGGDRTVAETALNLGENEVIVGGQHSPFRFTVVVSHEQSVDDGRP
ncbi:MAG TPA: hypothetical protein DCP37_16490 [Dehalococcoidia bacterium]|nr:hypothetical protein [Dehalococcoidia bacterium]